MPRSMHIICVRMIKGWYLSPHSGLVSYTSIKVVGEARRGKLLISSDHDPKKDATREVSGRIGLVEGEGHLPQPSPLCPHSTEDVLWSVRHHRVL